MTNNLDLASIFDVYSQRCHSASSASQALTDNFKVRVIKWLDVKIDDHNFWNDLYHRLILVYGTSLPLSNYEGSLTYKQKKAIVNFLSTSNNVECFDFIESVCKSEALFPQWTLSSGRSNLAQDFVNAVNKFFEMDGLPYFLTAFEFGSTRRHQSGRPGQLVFPYSVPEIRVYPQIIDRDNEVIHETAIKPTLTFLARPTFASANEEFLDALKDYREGDYRDCVVKCGSSLESVMKIICDENGWPPQRGAGKLLNVVLSKTALPGFLKHPLIQIATIRNGLGSAHGAGVEPRDVTQHLAQYTINVTASAILLLVEETKP